MIFLDHIPSLVTYNIFSYSDISLIQTPLLSLQHVQIAMSVKDMHRLELASSSSICIGFK